MFSPTPSEALPAQGVIDRSTDATSNDLAISLACLANARRDLELSIGAVEAALKCIQVEQMASPPSIPDVPGSTRIYAEGLSSSSLGPAPKRHASGSTPDVATHVDACDRSELPEVIELAIDALAQLRERVSGQVTDSLQARLQMTTGMAQTCVARLNRDVQLRGERHGAWITTLPPEIGMHILRMLPLDSQSRAAATCHTVQRWSEQLLAARTRVCTNDVRRSAGVNGMVCVQKGGARQAELRCVNKVLGWLAPRCPNLRVICLTRSLELRDGSLLAVLSHALALRHVDVSHCPELTDVASDAISTSCPQLVSLNVSGCSLLTNDGIAQLASRCRLLTTLRLSATSAGDRAVQAISLHCAQLKTLDLSHCSNVTEKGVQPIVRRCASLELLDLSHCDGIGDLFLGFNGLACTQLRELRLRSCQGVSDAAVLTVAIHCRDLRELDLSMCVHVTDYSLGAVGLYCRRLETLCVDSCVSIHAQSFVQLAEHLGQELLSVSMRSVSTITDDAVAAIGVHCTGLRYLDIANCPRIGDDGLMSIAFSCERLTSLNAQGCECVSDAAIIELCYGCPLLRHLNMQWCPLVTDDSLEVIGEVCRNLESLWLTGTDGGITDWGVAEIARQCHQLKTLCIRDCSTLTDSTACRIAMSCKQLAHFDVQGCVKISDAPIIFAAIQCPMLRVVNIEGCWRVSSQMMHAARKNNPELLIVAGLSDLKGAVACGDQEVLDEAEISHDQEYDYESGGA